MLTGAESPGSVCQGGWGQRKLFWNVSEKAKLRPQLSQGAGPRANKLQFCLQREKEAWVNETPDFPCTSEIPNNFKVFDFFEHLMKLWIPPQTDWHTRA